MIGGACGEQVTEVGTSCKQDQASKQRQSQNEFVDCPIERSQAHVPNRGTLLAKFLGIVFFKICAHGLQLIGGLSGSNSGLQVSKRFKNPMSVTANIQNVLAVHLFLVDDRHEEIGRYGQQSSAETRRRHTDDGKRMLVELNRTADHAAIVLKTAVPKCIAEHEIRCAVRAVLIGSTEEPAKIRPKL